jgi:hypothetical protein
VRLLIPAGLDQLPLLPLEVLHQQVLPAQLTTVPAWP